MKLHSWLFLSVLGFGIADTASAAVKVGAAAPDFSLSAQDGSRVSLSSFRGKYVVLEWFNKGCPFVRKHYDSGNMQKLQEAYGTKGVVWLSIASSAKGKEGYMSAEETAKLRGEWKIKSTATLLDPVGKAGRLYGAKTTPHMFIIDPAGKIIYQGAIDSTVSVDPEDIPKSTNYVSEALNAALAGQPVKASSTKPYGCSVKYE